MQRGLVAQRPAAIGAHSAKLLLPGAALQPCCAELSTARAVHAAHGCGSAELQASCIHHSSFCSAHCCICHPQIPQLVRLLGGCIYFL